MPSSPQFSLALSMETEAALSLVVGSTCIYHKYKALSKSRKKKNVKISSIVVDNSGIFEFWPKTYCNSYVEKDLNVSVQRKVWGRFPIII